MDILQNKTKVIATVGPASNSEEMLWKLIQAGVDVFRLNFSHGNHEDHLKVINLVRALNKKHGTTICLLQDLQGPKIRTGEVENNGVEIVTGQELILTTEKVIGNSTRIYTSYKSMPRDVKAGDKILIDDGNLELVVKSTKGEEVITQVVFGGLLKSKKGINLPNTKVSEPSLTEKDKEDLVFGLKHDLDWIALSFVRCAADITDIKAIINAQGKSAKVVAKIEKPEALDDIDAIIEACDGIMVARGDLGVEIEMEDVPLAQKMMISKCNQVGKPVIVATQMLESMVKNPRPTRAEAGDVANAVLDGADTVMLSAESASGSFPVEAVTSMVKIITAVEKGGDIYFRDYEMDEDAPNYKRRRVVASACRLAMETDAKAIVSITKSGYIPNLIASHRPDCPIYTFTDNAELVNKLNLTWGVTPFFFDFKYSSTDELIEGINKILVQKGLLKSGDLVINTGSMPIEGTFRTNMIKMSIIE